MTVATQSNGNQAPKGAPPKLEFKSEPPSASDPAVYAEYETKWATYPTDAAGWLQRAHDVAAVLSPDAAARERANKSPRAEVALLKHSGLLRLLGPKKYGGGEQPLSVGYQAIRAVAAGDGSVGMLLGYHLLWSLIAVFVGNAEQVERTHKLIIENNYYVGGAVNPRDSDLNITTTDDKVTFSGFKHFTTGAAISDLIVLEGALESAPEKHIFAVVPTKQEGIKFAYNWDNIGLRLTESGSATVTNVSAPWSDALGWDEKTHDIDLKVLGIPFATLLLPTIQLVFSSFYIGIARGALEAARGYTTTTTRPWPYSGDVKEKATDEHYILERYGNFFAHLRAAEALADKAGAEADRLHQLHGANHSTLTARERGDFAEWVASVKVVATDTALRITSGVFEVTGARATTAKNGLDRFWRDVRTHTLHDPVAYKNREQGRYFLVDELPTPTWYT